MSNKWLTARTSHYDEFWTMKDGKRVRVGDMGINHLRNALRLVIKSSRETRPIGTAFDFDYGCDWEMDLDIGDK